jgi:hypothetical protein
MSPEARISKNSGHFSSLPVREQAAVKKGELLAGMSPQTVRIAWGDPDRVMNSYEAGGKSVRWEYDTSRPVMSNEYYYNGRAAAMSAPQMGYSYAPQVVYYRELAAVVIFKDDKVISWSQKGR